LASNLWRPSSSLRDEKQYSDAAGWNTAKLECEYAHPTIFVGRSRNTTDYALVENDELLWLCRPSLVGHSPSGCALSRCPW